MVVKLLFLQTINDKLKETFGYAKNKGNQIQSSAPLHKPLVRMDVTSNWLDHIQHSSELSHNPSNSFYGHDSKPFYIWPISSFPVSYTKSIVESTSTILFKVECSLQMSQQTMIKWIILFNLKNIKKNK